MAKTLRDTFAAIGKKGAFAPPAKASDTDLILHDLWINGTGKSFFTSAHTQAMKPLESIVDHKKVRRALLETTKHRLGVVRELIEGDHYRLTLETRNPSELVVIDSFIERLRARGVTDRIINECLENSKTLTKPAESYRVSPINEER